MFLAFVEGFDGEAELLFELVVGFVVEVGDAAVDAQDGLGDAEFVFAGGEFIVDEGAGEVGFAVVASGEVDSGFAVFVLGWSGRVRYWSRISWKALRGRVRMVVAVAAVVYCQVLSEPVRVSSPK
ncbi:hypothetical protein FsymDg_2421 [Candidatus Protofrankia datiscae]|uniref:Uncharacterized protein n=1 Tax=Candidatus Protofrankia datiscae TaxID=2716812 RepID=F8B1D1_9ACTN|nr:hypothetical protein FsymDg_2421 [Candidatus Protofrankia datiscae]